MSLNNSIRLSGNLGKDAELKTMADYQILTFSMATQEKYKKRNSGEIATIVEWHKVVKYGKNLEKLSEILKKGLKVTVEGPLRSNTWEKDNVKRKDWYVRADEIQFISSPVGKTVGGENTPAGADDTTKQAMKPEPDDKSDDLPF